MVNITLSIPDEILDKMKKYPDIKWSEFVRRAILAYLDKLRGSKTRKSDWYVSLARKVGVDLDSISVDIALAQYEKMKKLECDRHSTTQTSS